MLAQAKDSSETVKILALLDPGSNRTFCSKSLADNLKVEGEPTTLSLDTLKKGPDADVSAVSFNLITGRKSKKVVSLSNVYAMKEFPELQSSIATQQDIQKWEHLKDLQAPNMSKELKVELIIGQDNPGILQPLEIRRGDKWDDPYALRTILGWAINGPLGGDSSSNKAISNFIHAVPGTVISLEEQVKKFWTVDGDQHLASTQQEMSANDIFCHLWDNVGQVNEFER